MCEYDKVRSERERKTKKEKHEQTKGIHKQHTKAERRGNQPPPPP